MLREANATLPGKESSSDRILPDYRRPPKHVSKVVKEKIIKGGKGHRYSVDPKTGKPKRHATAKHIRA